MADVTGLVIAVPVAITDANIDYLSVPEDDYPEWVPGETYSLGRYVKVTGVNIHQVWRSVKDNNKNHNPLGELDRDNPVNWSFVSATNAHKMFDQYISTKTEAPGTINFRLKNLGRVNSFALFGVKGSTVTFTVREENGTLISTETRDLVSYATFNSEYDWFFTPFLMVDFVIFEDIPPLWNTIFEVTIAGEGTVGIGAVVPAFGYEFNVINRSSALAPKSYSVKVDKTPGVFEFIEGPSALDADFEFSFEPNQVDLLNRLIRGQINKPTIVIGSRKYESFTSYGIIYECPNSLPFPEEGMARLKVESLF